MCSCLKGEDFLFVEYSSKGINWPSSIIRIPLKGQVGERLLGSSRYEDGKIETTMWISEVDQHRVLNIEQLVSYPEKSSINPVKLKISDIRVVNSFQTVMLVSEIVEEKPVFSEVVLKLKVVDASGRAIK